MSLKVVSRNDGGVREIKSMDEFELGDLVDLRDISDGRELGTDMRYVGRKGAGYIRARVPSENGGDPEIRLVDAGKKAPHAFYAFDVGSKTVTQVYTKGINFDTREFLESKMTKFVPSDDSYTAARSLYEGNTDWKTGKKKKALDVIPLKDDDKKKKN